MIRETLGNNGRCQKRECSMNGVDDKTRDATTMNRLSSQNRKESVEQVRGKRSMSKLGLKCLCQYK